MNWQPIATAPKMKTILLWAATDIGEHGEIRNWKMETGYFHTGFQGDDGWCWPNHRLAVYDIHPTHWQPLPPPPEPSP